MIEEFLLIILVNFRYEPSPAQGEIQADLGRT